MRLRSSQETRSDKMRLDKMAKTAHNTSSPLLKLPQEIKDQIYGYGMYISG